MKNKSEQLQTQALFYYQHQPMSSSIKYPYCKQTNNVLSQNSHDHDLNCFKKCSLWSINLSSISALIMPMTQTQAKGQMMMTQECLLGKVSPSPKANGMKIEKGVNDIMQFFPLDMRTNQRFVLDRNQPKMHLNLHFDLAKVGSSLSKLTPEYQQSTFEINLLASLHGKNVFKEPINFKVKGFDIIKSIIGRLNDKSLGNRSHYEQVMMFQTTVFNNIQCTFGVDFSISKSNLLKYIASGGLCSQNMPMISSYDVRITKLRITYCLPLCVFSYVNVSQKKISQVPIRAIMPINTNAINAPTVRRNFCNWHSFMSSTTPLIYESEDVLLKDVFNSFLHASLFGIDCLFKLSPTHYTVVKYFPTLSSTYIEEKGSADNRITSVPTMNQTNINNNNVNDSSTLDGSFITSISSTQEEKVCNTSTIHQSSSRSIIFKEKVNQIFNTKSYQAQLQSLFSKHSEIEDMSLADIATNSWFSILWTPIVTPQLRRKNEGMQFVSSSNFSSIQVYYHFRNAALTNTCHYLPIAGIREKNTYGQTIDTITQNGAHFWFGNNSMNFDQYYYEQDFYFNQLHFCCLNNNSNGLSIDL